MQNSTEEFQSIAINNTVLQSYYMPSEWDKIISALVTGIKTILGVNETKRGRYELISVTWNFVEKCPKLIISTCFSSNMFWNDLFIWFHKVTCPFIYRSLCYVKLTKPTALEQRVPSGCLQNSRKMKDSKHFLLIHHSETDSRHWEHFFKDHYRWEINSRKILLVQVRLRQ